MVKSYLKMANTLFQSEIFSKYLQQHIQQQHIKVQTKLNDIFVNPLVKFHRMSFNSVSLCKLHLQQQFYLFGFPTVLHSDNGAEFKNTKMAGFCERNLIKQVQSNPQTSTIQGLVECNNKTIKENMSNIFKEKGKNNQTWYTILHEAAYKKNITVQSATKKTPYEIVFSIKKKKSKVTYSIQLK